MLHNLFILTGIIIWNTLNTISRLFSVREIERKRDINVKGTCKANALWGNIILDKLHVYFIANIDRQLSHESCCSTRVV